MQILPDPFKDVQSTGSAGVSPALLSGPQSKNAGGTPALPVPLDNKRDGIMMNLNVSPQIPMRASFFRSLKRHHMLERKESPLTH